MAFTQTLSFTRNIRRSEWSMNETLATTQISSQMKKNWASCGLNNMTGLPQWRNQSCVSSDVRDMLRFWWLSDMWALSVWESFYCG
jgi:hypothetical protein